jgi:Na+-transporting NADH:ubiquinone oxidoreductase subunit D
MGKLKNVWVEGIWNNNAVIRQTLGICSALAVTNLVLNSLFMGIGLMFVAGFSSLTVSILRKYTPGRIRMMVQTLIIASFVIMVDIILKAYFPDASRALGPYVGLIITNCIIMGRCEAFAQSNPPLLSFMDGVFSGGGYALVLLFIATFREILGFGTWMGFQVLPQNPGWLIMVMPPGAFFMLACTIWAARSISFSSKKGTEKGVSIGG